MQNLGGSKTFTFNSLPKNVDELKRLSEAKLSTPYETAALTLLALTRYEESPEDCIEMLNFLKGPEEVSTYEKQFIRDRLKDKYYKVFSFFKGTRPDNNYTPSKPYTVTVSSNTYSFDNANWATLYLTSSGADSPRPVKLREKPSTGQWFLNEIQYLGDIRLPANEDKWK
ncbi:MAG: hypothetical protein GXY24_08780 [Bacteroidales bacterium]|nr:hypothetical protein [Bacteroidales bacterium]